MARTANVSARVDPEVKARAEAVLEEIGIAPSTLINMVYKQIIRCNGLPFDTRLPGKNPVSIDDMTPEEIEAKLEHSYQQSLNGETQPFDEFVKEFREQHGI